MIDGPFQHNALPLGGISCVVQDMMNVLNPPQLPIADEVDREMFSRHGGLDPEDWLKPKNETKDETKDNYREVEAPSLSPSSPSQKLRPSESYFQEFNEIM